MSYIGAQPTTAAFPFDQFSGNGSTTAFTMSYAPASTTSIVVSVSGVVQNPNTYSVSGLTLTFSGAPPTGTNNIGVLFLGLPASGVSTPGNTAYLSSTQFTATAGQTTFTPSGTYQTGFINVIRNGSQLAPTDYTATNGTTVVLNTAASLGDVVVIEVYNLVSVTNALPLTGGTVTGATTFNSTVSINGANGSGYTGYKNRIINGGMVIDQRNNGASGTAATTTANTVDRWGYYANQASKGTWQQNAGSVTPPAGYTNYLGFTSSSAYSVLAGDILEFFQRIEGYNMADFAWGTASAATVTLSFWVRSSLTGTFGGSISNNALTRSYPFGYTINSANTWEYKTVTIAGDTTGTWLTTNGTGANLVFSLGSGTTYRGTAGAWAAGIYTSVIGETSVVGTSGATFYITGVQLERGSNATSFEFRDYGRELQMCQRYYFRITPTSGPEPLGVGYAYATSGTFGSVNFPVSMRIRPTALEQSGTASDYRVVYGASITTNCTAVPAFSNANITMGQFVFTTAAVLTVNGGVINQSNTTNGYLAWSAEL